MFLGGEKKCTLPIKLLKSLQNPQTIKKLKVKITEPAKNEISGAFLFPSFFTFFLKL